MKYCKLIFSDKYGKTRDTLISEIYELDLEADYLQFMFPSQEIDQLLQSAASRDDNLDIVKYTLIVFLETKNLKLVNNTTKTLTFKEKGLFNYFSLASATIDLIKYTRRNGFMWSENLYDTLNF